MLIELDQITIDKCMKFALECVGTNKYYASRGQSNVDKITNDIFVGKCGEFASYFLLKSKFKDVIEPDVEIYRGGRKTHSADLEADGFKFSVKTQTLDSVKLYGMSWLMEKTAVPKFEGHHFILCLEVERGCILIQNVVEYNDIVSVLAEPRLKHLKSKCAFYYNDIILNKVKL